MKEWIIIADIEKQTGIPNPTIRRYIRKHGHHLNVRKSHKSYMVDAKSIPILVQIRDFYAKGMNTEQVEDTLTRRGAPVVITVNDNELVTISTPEALIQLQKIMTEVTQAYLCTVLQLLDIYIQAKKKWMKW